RAFQSTIASRSRCESCLTSHQANARCRTIGRLARPARVIRHKVVWIAAKRRRSRRIDKSMLALPEPQRVRDRQHLRYASGRVAKFLQQTQSLFLWRISFGLYLIHVPIAYTVVMAVAVLLWPMSAIALAVDLLIFIGLSIGLDWLMTVLVDAPALRLLAA